MMTKTTNSAPATLLNVSETHHHVPQQDQAHFIPSGTRLAKGNLEIFFLHDASNSPNREWTQVHAFWPSVQVRGLTERVIIVIVMCVFVCVCLCVFDCLLFCLFVFV